MGRVAIKPELVQWRRKRAGPPVDALASRFPKVPAWERGKAQPTIKQLEAFANATHVPIGYLFLPDPPEERLPIPDFRTVTGLELRGPSPDLLDTTYAMQQRQAWLRETLLDGEADPLEVR